MCHTPMWQGQESLFPIPHDLEGKVVWIGMPYLDSSTDHWSLTEASRFTYIVENLHRKELGSLLGKKSSGKECPMGKNVLWARLFS